MKPAPVVSAWFRRLPTALGATLLAAFVYGATPTQATENGTSFYLQGLRDPLAGLTPPPGVFFQTVYYHYDGSSGSKSVRFENAGLITVNVDSRAEVGLFIPTWVPDVKIGGGAPVFALIVPVGNPSVSANIQVSPPGAPPVVIRQKDAVTNFGDPAFAASMGWKHGNWNWNTGLLVNIPAGGYRKGELSNLAINRPAVDLNGAVTYLDPIRGFEVSAGGGVTFNGENDETHYTSGHEVHFDFSASKYLTRNLNVSFLAYHTQQITDDSGSGDVVGAFRGRVTAVGGSIGCTFPLGKIPVSAQLKVMQEIDVQKRLQGTVGFFSLTVPLYVNHPPKTNGPPSK